MRPLYIFLVSFLFLFSLTACGPNGEKLNVFRTAEQMLMDEGDDSTEVDNLPPVENPQPEPVILDKIKVVRACWDRPLNWPTINRTTLKAQFSFISNKQKVETKFYTKTDFYQTRPVIEVPVQFKGLRPTVEFCQANESGECVNLSTDNSMLKPGLLIVQKPDVKEVYDGDQVVWANAPFDVVRRVDLQEKVDDYQIEVVVDNLQQYPAKDRKQIQKDYCDVVYKTTSPLAVDFSGKGYLPRKQKTSFDLDGDGTKEKISSLGDEAGFLALDLNGNGKIDNGTELFGDQTVIIKNKEKAANGFKALQQYDSNNDYKLNKNDPIWSSLLVWVDANEDGLTQDGELKTMDALSIAVLEIGYLEMTDTDYFGNEARQQSYYESMNGTKNLLCDIWFFTINQVHSLE